MSRPASSAGSPLVRQVARRRREASFSAYSTPAPPAPGPSWTRPSPPYRRGLAYVHDRGFGFHAADCAPNKFAAAGLTGEPSHLVRPPRVTECPIQLEARAEWVQPDVSGGFVIVEAVVRKVHADSRTVVPGTDHIDPAAWSPLIFNGRRAALPCWPGPSVEVTWCDRRR